VRAVVGADATVAATLPDPLAVTPPVRAVMPPLDTSVVPLKDRPLPRVIADGADELPVGLPCKLLAAKFACLARVTALAAIVPAALPGPVAVTSPVSAVIPLPLPQA
jgi:hypothetical protein